MRPDRDQEPILKYCQLHQSFGSHFPPQADELTTKALQLLLSQIQQTITFPSDAQGDSLSPVFVPHMGNISKEHSTDLAFHSWNIVGLMMDSLK